MKKYKRILCFTLMLSFALLSLGCSSNIGRETNVATETKAPLNYIKPEETTAPSSTEYSVEFIDGVCYINLADFDFYKEAPLGEGDQYIGKRGAAGYNIADLKDRLLSGELDEFAKRYLARLNEKEGRIKLCNFDDIYVPVLPENLRIFSIEVFSENDYLYRITGANDENFNGNYLYFSQEECNKMRENTVEMESRTISNDTKSIELFYKWNVASNNGQNQLNYCVFVTQDNICYCYNGTLDDTPSDEWLLSFGVEKYVEEPNQ